MEVAETYFGHGRTTFAVVHPTGIMRTYEHFRDVWDDTIDARIYQGIHFRTADENGVQLGRDVARWVDQHALKRQLTGSHTKMVESREEACESGPPPA